MLLSLTQTVAAVAQESASSITILVAYDSRTGNTETFARAVAEGIESVDGVDAVASNQADIESDAIASAAGVVVGTPVHWGNLSSNTKAFLDKVGGALAQAGEIGADSTPTTRTAGAFATGGSVASGKELARISILSTLLSFKYVVIGAEDAAGFGTLGPQATTGPSDPGLSEAELEEARNYGVRFATLTKKLTAP